MEDLIKVNPNEKNYYGEHYNIFLWCGCGYSLQGFDVYANNIDEALEIVVAYCDNNNLHGFLIDVEDVEDEEDDQYIYIDATMNGATKPYYIYSELKIVEI